MHQVTQCKKDLQQANRGEWLCGTGAPGWVEGQLPSNVGDKVHPHSPALTELPTRWTVGCASATRMTTASGRQTSRSLHVTAFSFTTFPTPQSAPLDTVVLTEWTNTRNGLDPNTCLVYSVFMGTISRRCCLVRLLDKSKVKSSRLLCLQGTIYPEFYQCGQVSA